MLFIGIQMISGVMLGVEFNWKDRMLVVDLFILRLVFQIEDQQQ